MLLTPYLVPDGSMFSYSRLEQGLGCRATARHSALRGVSGSSMIKGAQMTIRGTHPLGNCTRGGGPVGDKRCEWKLVNPVDVGIDDGDNTPFWQCRSMGPCWHRNGPKERADTR